MLGTMHTQSTVTNTPKRQDHKANTMKLQSRIINMRDWLVFMFFDTPVFLITLFCGEIVDLKSFTSLSLVANPDTFDQHQLTKNEIQVAMATIAGFGFWSTCTFGGLLFGLFGSFGPADTFYRENQDRFAKRD